MAQNIYDDPEFFAAYAQLPRSRAGLAAAPEWPDLQTLLPELAGRRVLDLGCGYGWFSRYAADQGAALVVGVDISERMLAVARHAQPGAATPSTAGNLPTDSRTQPTANAAATAASADGDLLRDAGLPPVRSVSEASPIAYRQADLDAFDPDLLADFVADGRFDLVYSSLTFHYVRDFERLMVGVRQVVSDGATLVCSVEHPVATAPRHPQMIDHEFDIDDPAAVDKIDNVDSVDNADRIDRVWPLDGYFDEGDRVTNWLAPGVVKQHRTIESYVRGLGAAGFAVTGLIEWHPSVDDLTRHPDWAEFNEHPSFLLLRGDR